MMNVARGAAMPAAGLIRRPIVNPIGASEGNADP